MPAASYVLIVRPDPQVDGRYVALCPDIPGWYATGSSPSEASTIGTEIIRGIVAERRANGTDIPAVHTQAVPVSVAAPPASATAASPSKPPPSLSESDGFQALASVVAETRGAFHAERNGSQHASASEVQPGRVLKSDRIGPSQ